MQLNIYHKLPIYLLLIWPFLFAKGQEIEYEKLRISSSASEMAPYVHDSVLYFVSNRKNSVLITVFNQADEHLYSLYQAPINNDGTTGKATMFQPIPEINIPSGPAAFAPNGQFHMVTRNKVASLREARSRKKDIPLGLYQSKRLPNNRWDAYTPVAFSENSDFSYGQPSVSPDGKQLYFVSDQEGGQGKTDIYMSTRVADGWSEPVNLGSAINTPGRELFPYYHPSGKLYFASDGHEGPGGIDIYYSVFDGSWSQPVPLEAPINSEFDDFSCFINPNETSGYFASNREGPDNIYRFNYKIEFCENPSEVVEENYCFTFFEASAGEIDTTTLRYRWEFSDGFKAEGLEVDHCLPGPGVYQINLNVVDAITGEEQYNVASYELPLEKPQQVYFTLPETVNANQMVVLKAELTGFEDAENIQYFWDLDEKEKQIGETISHIFRKKGKYQIKCEAYWGQDQKICSYRTVIVE